MTDRTIKPPYFALWEPPPAVRSANDPPVLQQAAETPQSGNLDAVAHGAVSQGIPGLHTQPLDKATKLARLDKVMAACESGRRVR